MKIVIIMAYAIMGMDISHDIYDMHVDIWTTYSHVGTFGTYD